MIVSDGDKARRRESLLQDPRVKSVTREMSKDEIRRYIDNLINEMSYDERSISSSQMIKQIESIPTDRERADYILGTIEKIRNGEIHVAKSTLNKVYDSLSRACTHVVYDSKLVSQLNHEASESKNMNDLVHAEYLRHISKKMEGRANSSMTERRASLTSKVAAAFIIGMGIFSLRSMTGNVMMNVSDISAQAAGSVLMGILAVGAFTLLIPRLTAKP